MIVARHAVNERSTLTSDASITRVPLSTKQAIGLKSWNAFLSSRSRFGKGLPPPLVNKHSSTQIVPTPTTLLPPMNNVVPFSVFPQARRAVD